MKNLKKWSVLLLTLALTFAMAAPAMATGTGFSDVPADADYADAVAWCFEEKLMQGVSTSSFDPNGTLTRAMVATVLYRAEGEPVVDGTVSFTDVRPGQWYSNAILWANQNGIVQGYGNGLFGTDDSITKEQLDVIVRRYQGESPAWMGNPALAVPATRAEAAVAFYTNLRKEEPEEQSGKVLVAYFSATNNTEGIAQHIQSITGGDIFEVVPEIPYTSDDLNYNTDCRANREQNDDNARPAIAQNSKVNNMEDYDIIFLGYPIWWGQAPKIMYTFLESYDMNGKTIVPFCTSGSSGIGSSATNLKDAASSATWLDGRRFSSGTSQSAVETWVNGLGLTLTPGA